MIHITTIEEFNTICSQNEKVIIDAYAEWCGPCKQMAPVFEEYSKKYTNCAFFKINTDASDSLASFLNISALPSFIIIVNSKVVNTIIGANKQKLEQAIIGLS